MGSIGRLRTDESLTSIKNTETSFSRVRPVLFPTTTFLRNSPSSMETSRIFPPPSARSVKVRLNTLSRGRPQKECVTRIFAMRANNISRKKEGWGRVTEDERGNTRDERNGEDGGCLGPLSVKLFQDNRCSLFFSTVCACHAKKFFLSRRCQNRTRRSYLSGPRGRSRFPLQLDFFFFSFEPPGWTGYRYYPLVCVL